MEKPLLPLIKPNFPPPGDLEQPGGAASYYKYLAAVGLTDTQLQMACVKLGRVIKIHDAQHVTVLIDEVEYEEVPVHIHTDVGARTRMLKEENEQELSPEDFFYKAAYIFPYEDDVLVMCIYNEQGEFVPVSVFAAYDNSNTVTRMKRTYKPLLYVTYRYRTNATAGSVEKTGHMLYDIEEQSVFAIPKIDYWGKFTPGYVDGYQNIQDNATAEDGEKYTDYINRFLGKCRSVVRANGADPRQPYWRSAYGCQYWWDDSLGSHGLGGGVTLEDGSYTEVYASGNKYDRQVLSFGPPFGGVVVIKEDPDEGDINLPVNTDLPVAHDVELLQGSNYHKIVGLPLNTMWGESWLDADTHVIWRYILSYNVQYNENVAEPGTGSFSFTVELETEDERQSGTFARNVSGLIRPYHFGTVCDFGQGISSYICLTNKNLMYDACFAGFVQTMIGDGSAGGYWAAYPPYAAGVEAGGRSGFFNGTLGTVLSDFFGMLYADDQRNSMYTVYADSALGMDIVLYPYSVEEQMVNHNAEQGEHA